MPDNIKRYSAFAALCVGTALLAFDGGATLQTAPLMAACERSEPKSYYEYRYCEDSKPFLRKTLSDPVSLYTLWLAGLTGVLALVGMSQGRALRDQIRLGGQELAATRDAANAAVAAERAYMFFGLEMGTPPPEEETWFNRRARLQGAATRRPVVLDATFSNFGKTPAVLEWVSIVFLDAVPTVPRPQFRTASSEPLAPVPADRKHVQNLPPFEPQDLRNNPIVAGQFIYRDMFGSRWRSTFCVEINAAAITDPAGPRLFLTPVGPPAWNSEERAT